MKTKQTTVELVVAIEEAREQALRVHGDSTASTRAWNRVNRLERQLGALRAAEAKPTTPIGRQQAWMRQAAEQDALSDVWETRARKAEAAAETARRLQHEAEARAKQYRHNAAVADVSSGIPAGPYPGGQPACSACGSDARQTNPCVDCGHWYCGPCYAEHSCPTPSPSRPTEPGPLAQAVKS